MNLLDSKKGLLKETVAGIILLFVAGFVSVFCYLFLSDFIAAFAATPMWNAALEDAGNRFLFTMKLFDYFTVLLMVGVIMGIAVSAYRIASAPIYFLLTLITCAFMGMISYYFSFLFQEMVRQSVFDASTKYFSSTIMICTNLHWVGLAMFITGSIALYGKVEKGQYLP